MEYRLRRGVLLHKMMHKCPKIKRSILNLIKRIITLIHSESFNPASVEFMSMSPAGEEDKIIIVLDKAEYMSEPLIEPEAHPSDSTYQMTSFVDSLYKAIVGHNGAMEGFLACCPGLATVTYSVANHLLTYWYEPEHRDMAAEIVWDSFDWHVTGDLMIMGNIHA